MNDIIKQKIIALLQSNQPAHAKELCQEYVQTSTDPHVLILLANAQLRLGEIEAAVSSACQAINGGWNDPKAFVMLVALLLHRGEQAAAESWFSEAEQTRT